MPKPANLASMSDRALMNRRADLREGMSPASFTERRKIQLEIERISDELDRRRRLREKR